MKKLVVLLVVLASCSGSEKEKTLLSPKEFQAKLAATPGAMLIDVRMRDEVLEGYVKGAVNFDFKLPEFNQLIAGLDKSKPYFVYCASGVRSGKAAEKMRDLDFQHVYLLDGGLKAWKAEGLPVATQSQN